MPDDTPNLGLPFILPAQAQKHVTHNEAISLLDVLVQSVAQSRSQVAPPVAPLEGEIHLVGPGAGGDWAGHDAHIAVQEDGGWRFIVPKDGWTFRVLDDASTVVFAGGSWTPLLSGELQVQQLGVGTTSDSTNRLAVASDAVLLTHAGDDHRLKINKAGTGDTATLLFQSGFSGRAEMGLAGNDAFSIKVSPDGSAFLTGMSVDPATGRPGFPQGITVDALVTGAAVTQSATDVTAGRLVKTGDFGLGRGNAAAPLVADMDAHRVTGLFAFDGTTVGRPAPLGSFLHLSRASDSASNAAAVQQLAFAANGAMFARAFDLGLWSAWTPVFTRASLLGTVSQTTGIPTGAVIERGSNANGEYVRFADGTQICVGPDFTGISASTAAGGIFRNATPIDWTFPAAFANAASVAGSAVAQGNSQTHWTSCRVVSTTSMQITVFAPASTTGRVVRPSAVGRWF